MKHDCPSLLAALTVGVLVNVLLRSESAYWPQAGVATAFVCAPVLAGIAWLFSRAWHYNHGSVLRILFVALLFYASILELLRFWNLAQRLYPGSLSMTAVWFMAILPVLYLRRISSISQTAHVILCLLLLATVFMLLTVIPRLKITNLQVEALTFDDFASAAKEQLIVYPEYLLPALVPVQEKQHRQPLLRLAAIALWFDVGIHFVLELFYGAAMPLRTDPLHAVARCGALSVFNRLESLQLILWSMAITLKLALYLYAICLLVSKSRKKAETVSLNQFLLYGATLWLTCSLLQKTDVSSAAQIRSYLTWGIVLLTWMGGVAAWGSRKIRCGL